jgi:hypothetical protein
MRYPATQTLVDQGLFGESPFTLIDVGCSGGIAKAWRVFGRGLRAYGIDPMLAEIEKLKAAETNPNVTYHAGYIGLPDHHPLVQRRGFAGPVGNSPWERLSTAWAMKLSCKGSDDNETKIQQNRWPETQLADPTTKVTLDDFMRTNQVEDVDFIKIDIDNDDFFALLSCEETIDSCGVIGFMLEVNYCGTDSDTDHTFHNSDRFMRKHHFELVDLSIRRYSRKAMPAPFVLPKFAQTTWGAPFQGDAVYLRDMANGLTQVNGSVSPTTKLLKAVALCEIFGLPDCATELLTVYERQLSEIVDVEALLDLLTPELNGRKLSYKDYIRVFSENPLAFYPVSEIHRSDESRGNDKESKKRWSHKLKKTLRNLSGLSRSGKPAC